MNSYKVTGIILAGGKSSRMETDKSFIELAGKPLIRYAIEALEPICDRIIISSNRPVYGFTGYESWPDTLPVDAPMGGIFSCLNRSETQLNIIHTCDMPMVGTSLFKYLLGNVEGYQVVVPSHHEDLVEPLCGIYLKGTTGLMAELIQQNKLSLHGFINRAKHRILSINQALPFYTELMFSNINTKDDLNYLSLHL